MPTARRAGPRCPRRATWGRRAATRGRPNPLRTGQTRHGRRAEKSRHPRAPAGVTTHPETPISAVNVSVRPVSGTYRFRPEMAGEPRNGVTGSTVRETKHYTG